MRRVWRGRYCKVFGLVIGIVLAAGPAVRFEHPVRVARTIRLPWRSRHIVLPSPPRRCFPLAALRIDPWSSSIRLEHFSGGNALCHTALRYFSLPPGMSAIDRTTVRRGDRPARCE